MLLPLFLLASHANGTEQLQRESNQPETAQLQQSAALIFQNECASSNACLTAWNKGEGFASLGIGHFIWYPAGTKKTFKESFPALLSFMQQHGATLPGWLSTHPDQANPWHNRTAFLAAYDSKQMQDLRSFLIHSKPLQARFMLQRLRSTLPSLLTAVDPAAQQHIRSQFEYVAASPMGLYVLMDYVNFKGEGTSPLERYQGKGWGMLQVLEHMSVTQPGLAAIQAFAQAGDAMLSRRVALSPPERHEQRWLPGWRKRLATYMHEAQQLFEHSGR
ncbi:MAG: hypothetical protein Q9M16_01865 [Mariprofundus sp.]|nr:hypothetical protein [Mariprofundus sp.]